MTTKELSQHEIKRYSMSAADTVDGPGCFADEDSLGNWVKVEDHWIAMAALRAEIEKLNALIQSYETLNNIQVRRNQRKDKLAQIDERTEFEKVFSDIALDRSSDNQEAYGYLPAVAAWQGWQARAKLERGGE